MSDRPTRADRARSDRWTPANVMRAGLALCYVALLAWCIALSVHGHDRGDGALILIGAVSAATGVVVQYYFGSSQGSAEKSDALEQSVPASGVAWGRPIDDARGGAPPQCPPGLCADRSVPDRPQPTRQPERPTSEPDLAYPRGPLSPLENPSLD